MTTASPRIQAPRQLTADLKQHLAERILVLLGNQEINEQHEAEVEGEKQVLVGHRHAGAVIHDAPVQDLGAVAARLALQPFELGDGHRR